MKNFIVAAIAASSILATSCGGTSTQAPKTEQDSVAYATGVLATTIIQQQLRGDSTVKSEKAMQAFKDAFSDPKKAEAKIKELQAQMAELQSYMVAAQFAQQVRTQVDSNFNVGVILAGIQDSWNKTATLKPEEANAKIIKYIDTKAAQKETDFLAEVDKKAGIQKSGSELRYTVETVGEGKVGDKDTVMVNYTLIDMNGKELQTTVGQEPLKVAMPNGTVPGFSEGLQLLGKGGKATIYVPSKLGYGASAAQHQLGGQALTFKIEVLDIIAYDSIKNAAVATK